MRVLDYDLNKTVTDMAYQICKFQLNDALFLKYKPSQISASACILSINIYEENLVNEKKGSKSFFDNGKKGSFEINTDIWNNKKVKKLTGYSITDIKECLYDLATFISNNL